MSTYEAWAATAKAVWDRVQITFEPADRELQHAFLDTDRARDLYEQLESALIVAETRPRLERDALQDATYQVTFEATLTMEVTGEQLEPWALRDVIVEAYDTGDFSPLCDELLISTNEVDAAFGPHRLNVYVSEVNVEVV